MNFFAGVETDLAYGSHIRIARAVGSVKITVKDAQQVELVSSLLPDPAAQMAAPLPATTVAIHMDRSVARDLFLQLRETFQTMDWPLPEKDAKQV